MQGQKDPEELAIEAMHEVICKALADDDFKAQLLETPEIVLKDLELPQEQIQRMVYCFRWPRMGTFLDGVGAKIKEAATLAFAPETEEIEYEKPDATAVAFTKPIFPLRWKCSAPSGCGMFQCAF